MAQEKQILRVAARTSVKELAAALSHAVYDGAPVEMHAIGAGAVNQAVKAVAVAQGLVGTRGLVLHVIPGFVEKVINGETVSGINLRVRAN